MPREKDVENQIKAHVTGLYRADSTVVKIHASGEQGKNTLDLIGSYYGRPFQVEVKKPGHSGTEIQDYFVKRARAGGYVAGVVESLEQFLMMFSERG